MNPRLSRMCSLAAAAVIGLASMNSAAQSLFDPSKVGQKSPSPPTATAAGLFADQRVLLGSKVYVLESNVLTMRQTPSFDAPVVPICANAGKHTVWRSAVPGGAEWGGMRYEFQLKAYQDARLRIERHNHPTLEFDTLWAHLADTAGQGCDGWLRIDAPYVLEPRTGDYAASPLKKWNDQLHDKSASVDVPITLRSNVMLGMTPFGAGGNCLAGTEVVKTGETRNDGPRVAFKVRVIKGSTPHCQTGAIGWLRGDTL